MKFSQPWQQSSFSCYILIYYQLWHKQSEMFASASLYVTDGTDTSAALCTSLCFCMCMPARITVVSQSECVIDSCHLLHELAKLPAAWVAVTHVLGRCDHGADALPIWALRRAVDLPALLRPWVQSLQKQKKKIIHIHIPVKKVVVCVSCCLSKYMRADTEFFTASMYQQ